MSEADKNKTGEWDEIEKVLDSMKQGYMEESVQKLMSVYADNTVSFWSSGAVLEGKDEHKKAFKKAFKELDDFEFSWLLIDRHIEGNAAWITGYWSWSALYGPEKTVISRDTRATFIFIKQDGEWKFIHEHVSVRPVK